MFFHHRDLAYTVRVDKPNPVFARMLQQAIGGPEGELRVMTQYLFQGFGYRGPKRYRDMLLATGTEEIGHVELLSTAVAMNLEGAKAHEIDEVVTNPAVAARMGSIEPRHFLSSGLAATPADANGVPFSTATVDIAGNLIANMYANVAAEAVGRTLATRLLELTDDPGMEDMLKFLIARDTMHQQQWLAVIEELEAQGANGKNAPGDYENEPEYEKYAYAFFNHNMDAPMPADARFTSGPSLDGRGTFSLLEPAPALGQEPDLQRVPAEVHAGLEATGPSGAFAKIADGLRGAVGKVTPGG
jgi:Mn-containing catalase